MCGNYPVDVKSVVFLIIQYLNAMIALSLHCFFSYLANQCWNGGYIYLIMLRRVKRKAPLPPSDLSDSVSAPVSKDQQQERATTEPSDRWANCKRTRKFGVISRASFNRDNRDNTDPAIQSCYNGYNSSIPTNTGVSPPGEDSNYILSTHSPAEESPDTFLQVKTVPQRLHSGGTATLPTRCHSHLLEWKMDSFSSEPSSQVRHTADIQSYDLMHNYRGQVRGTTSNSPNPFSPNLF